MAKLIARNALTEAVTSPLAQRVAVAVFVSIVFIELVILVPSYGKREAELLNEVVGLGRELAQMEFSAINSNLNEEVRDKAGELLEARFMKGVVIALDGKQVYRAGDTGGVGLYDGAAATAMLDGFPYRKLAADRMEFLIGRSAANLRWDVTLVADISHIPAEMRNYVFRIGGLIVVISLFVTLVTMLVLWHILLRPVLILSDQMNRTGDRFTNPVDLPASLVLQKTEIGTLYRAFSRMLEAIGASVRATEDIARFPAENPNPIIRCSPDGAVIYANESARRHADFFAVGFKQQVSEAVARHVTESFLSGDQQEFELTVGDRVFTWSAVPFPSQRYVNLYGRDVTQLKRVDAELKRKSADLAVTNEKLMRTMAGLELEIAKRTNDLVEANEALRHQMQIAAMAENRFRAFAASAADWYWEMDRDLRFSYFSEDFERVTGVAPDMLLGKTRQETGIPGVNEVAWRKHLDDLSNRRAFRNFVHPRRMPDGSTVYLSINGVPILDEDGTFYGYRGTGSDVTVIHEAAEEMRRAKELAEAAARAKSDFLATMSHEIRTPMNGIIGMTELLSETSLHADQKAYVDTVLSSAKGLMQILNDVLDLAKFESGGFELDNVAFPLSELVEAVVEPISLQAAQRGNNLAVIVDPTLPWSVVGDPNRLRQVLLNLAGNAVKFTENGEITIEIVAQHRTDDRVTIMFDVRDTGIGIALEHQDRLFKDFSQIDQSVTREYGGTGLGLSISKRLVELMGGTIGVTSELGVGSSFRFVLGLPIAARERGADETAYLRGLRAIVIDDNEVNLRVMSGHLAVLGMNFETEQKPEAGLVRIIDAARSDEPFDVVFLDYSMPDLDGVAVLRGLASACPADALPKRLLVSSIMTSWSEDAEIASLVDARIMKPVTRKSLLAGLAQAFGRPLGMPPGKDGSASGSGLRKAAGDAPPPRLLLAEDNDINARIAINMLQKLGCEVDVAADGREAVEAAAFVPYDLILMDIHMPHMDGVEAARTIKSAGGPNAATPILAVTADVMMNVAEEPYRSLFADVLAKPYTSVALHAVLSDLMGGAAENGEPDGDANAVPGVLSVDRVIVDDLVAQLGADEAVSILRAVLGDLDAIAPTLADCDEADTAHMASAAHARAGSTGATGLVAVAGALRGLEQAARGGDIEAWRRGVAALPEIVAAARAALDTLIDEIAPDES